MKGSLSPFHREAVQGLEHFTLLFPLWTLLAALLSLLQPGLFSWVAGPVIVWSLALIMLGMGLGLSPADFRRAMIPPRAALIGVGAQFSGDALPCCPVGLGPAAGAAAGGWLDSGGVLPRRGPPAMWWL